MLERVEDDVSKDALSAAGDDFVTSNEQTVALNRLMTPMTVVALDWHEAATWPPTLGGIDDVGR